MNGLGKYVNAKYFSAANALAGKKACRKVTAYVESYDDIFFWRSILSQLESDSLKFVVTLPSHEKKLERGKKAAMMSAIAKGAGPDMIACVDADYDYLRQGCNDFSRTVITSPYVFHTYAYSIENLQCWAPSLHDVCVAVALNDSPAIIDFEAFLADFSRAVYPLFVWSVLLCRHPEYARFDISDFMNVIKTGAITKRELAQVVNRVGHKAAVKTRHFERTMSEKTLRKYDALKDELRTLGITPDDTYLYIQGHQLFNEIVAPLITSVCNTLIRQRESEINVQSKHRTQRSNEISCYERSVENVSSMLKKNTGYLRSTLVARIMSDLKTFIATTQNKNVRERPSQRN
ncbi:MAG: DUF4435 domain-containing protein [Prevotella sp.]|nr:DUF4435 domain-containing protein [Prevotella sp.]